MSKYKTPIQGCRRIVRKFAWLPTRCSDGKVCWLKNLSHLEEYYSGYFTHDGYVRKWVTVAIAQSDKDKIPQPGDVRWIRKFHIRPTPCEDGYTYSWCYLFHKEVYGEFGSKYRGGYEYYWDPYPHKYKEIPKG